MLFVPADLLFKLFLNTYSILEIKQSSSWGLLGLVFLWGFSFVEGLIRYRLIWK